MLKSFSRKKLKKSRSRSCIISQTSDLKRVKHSLFTLTSKAKSVFFLLLCSYRVNAFTLTVDNSRTPRNLPSSSFVSPKESFGDSTSTSLHVFFRKSSNDPDGGKIREEKLKAISQKDGKIIQSRGLMHNLKKPFVKRTDLQSAYADTAPALHLNQMSEQPKRGAGARIVESNGLGFFQRRSSHSQNLEVHADPSTNSLSRLLRGKIGRVHVNFDRLVFPRIKISGGGQFCLPHGCSFALLSIPHKIQTSFGVKRFTENFELEANNVIFTQDDVMNSFWIRKGLELLLNRILKCVIVRTMGGVAVIKCSVDTVKILENGKISCTGKARPQSGTPVPFEVTTGLKTSPTGRILHFPGIEMHLFPFEGFLPHHKPVFNIPLHKFLSVDLDIGKNANLKVRLDGERRRMEVSLWALVTPLKLDRDRVECSGREEDYKKNAKFYCDFGRWVTKIGRFAE